MQLSCKTVFSVEKFLRAMYNRALFIDLTILSRFLRISGYKSDKSTALHGISVDTSLNQRSTITYINNAILSIFIVLQDAI